MHNPTQLNHQGPDHGTQYRSVVFPAKRRAAWHRAGAYIAQLNGAKVFSAPIVTKIEDFKGFYPAEQYHQNYLVLHPDSPYIAINDIPKVAQPRRRCTPDIYRTQPVLVTPRAAGRPAG